MTTACVWLTNDLRIDDHPFFCRIAGSYDHLMPVIIDDPLEEMGPHRRRFFLETIDDLKTSLKKLGSDLIILQGSPEKLLADLFADQFYTARPTEAKKQAVIDTLPHPFSYYEGSALFDSCPVDAVPPTFSRFRNKVEKKSRVPPPLDPPASLPPLPSGRPESLETLPFEGPDPDPRIVMPFRGGESAGKERLASYIWETEAARHYKKTRNGLLDADDSSKLSPWLALGALSARRLYDELTKFEKQKSSTYWLKFELLWREFFLWSSREYGSKLYEITGIQDKPFLSILPQEKFSLWADGKTGVPFVDAFMRELKNTGFMSNRGRQIVASYLSHDLQGDWTWGARWFETHLIDYDPCSNWGNWQYIAGVGHSPKDHPYFDTEWQQNTYDPDRTFTSKWSEPPRH